MRFPLLLAWFLIAAATVSVQAGGKGKGGGGGQGHAPRPHAVSPPKAHPHASNAPAPRIHAPSANHPAPSARPHAAPQPRPQAEAVTPTRESPAATQPKTQAGGITSFPATRGTPSFQAGGSVPTSGQAASTTTTSAPSPSPSPTATATTATPAGTAVSATPLLASGALLPFGSNPAAMLSHGYHAHRGYYGYGSGYRGYGYRNLGYATARLRRLSRLVRDLNTLTVGYVAPANDRTVLRSDLNALSQGGMRPPSAGVVQLAQDLINHLPRRATPLLNTERLALDLETVMNGSRLNPTRVNSAINSARSLLRGSSLAQPAVETLTTDMRTVGLWRTVGAQAGLMR